jgi:hypothetical protein
MIPGFFLWLTAASSPIPPYMDYGHVSYNIENEDDEITYFAQFDDLETDFDVKDTDSIIEDASLSHLTLQNSNESEEILPQPVAKSAPPSAGGVIDFADFYSLALDSGLSLSIDGGSAFEFMNDGPAGAAGTISRIGSTTFQLGEAGVYQIYFQIYADLSNTASGQTVLALDSGPGFEEIPYTLIGNTVLSPTPMQTLLSGMAIIRTTDANTFLELRNPSSSASFDLSLFSGLNAVVSHLMISRIQ